MSNGDRSDFIAITIVPWRPEGAGRLHETQFGQLLDSIPEGIVALDRTGRIQAFSKPAERIFGCEARDVLGRTLATILPEFEFADAVSSLSKDTVGRRHDGSTVAVNVLMDVSEAGGEKVCSAIITDITERQAVSRALAESDTRYALAASGANDGLWDWNLEDGTVHFSARWRTLLGLEEENIKYSPEEWLSRIHPEDVDSFCNRFDAHLEGKTSQFEHEYRMRHADGQFRWVLARGVAARRENGEPYLLAGSQADISDRKRAEENLTHGALHDALTGLPNRGLLLDRVGQALARLVRNAGYKFALAVLDLDRFMIVNESLGHAAGDELLVSLAQRLELKMTPGNTLARLGGDEFAILIEEFESLDGVRGTIEDLQKTISQPFDINGEEIFVSASFGVAIGAPGYKRAEEVLRDADLAMYRAKKEGSSGFETFDENRHRRAVNQLQVESWLRRALDNGDIILHYQPIIDLNTGVISGFEALARIAHPTRGIVPPGEFIGIAEETGLIIPLGEQVLARACATVSEWQQRFDLQNKLSMSVNLSARHISEENIVTLLDEILTQSGLAPKDLKIEITESLIMTNPELAAQTLSQIKELGVTLSLDDFGTGYSSLSYLRRFPIDTLKMDRSFVGRMDSDERDMELVRMIILLAHTLGMEVIGEGIESESQLGLLRELNCEQGQGFFFAKPLPEDEAAGLLAAPPKWR
ncbi:MAG: EAL domain-containing protein [Alphaproteobacteria bacterium]|nr:EAL domain-containing protein [Alphaproteobacteria bacterium]